LSLHGAVYLFIQRVLGGAFLQVQSYKHLQRWTEEVWQRPAVQRGRIVNRTWGEPWEMLPERHDASNIDEVLALKP